jgi:hypothetical protein
MKGCSTVVHKKRNNRNYHGKGTGRHNTTMEPQDLDAPVNEETDAAP